MCLKNVFKSNDFLVNFNVCFGFFNTNKNKIHLVSLIG